MLLVFGSLNVDMLFALEALPRPGETVLCPGYELAAGGKGANQAAAAAKAGAEVRMVGHVGDDGFGRLARRSLEEAGAHCAAVAISARPTGTAVIGVDRRGENQIMVGSGANLDTRADQLSADLLSAGATLLCQNEVRVDQTFAALERARARGARTILNLAPAGPIPGHVLDGVDVLVVNTPEAATAAGVAGPGDPLGLARTLVGAHGLTCIVTLGADGAIAMAPQGGLRVGALPITAKDTTGAGDAFVGVLGAALDRGEALAEALRRASVAAGLACTAIGAQSAQPGADAIAARLADLPPPVPLA